MNGEQTTDGRKAYRIGIRGPTGQIIGYWRRFDTGAVALFESRIGAQLTASNYMLDAEIQAVQPEVSDE